MRKRLLWLLPLLVTLALVAACGGAATPEPAAQEEPAAEEPAAEDPPAPIPTPKAGAGAFSPEGI